MTDLHQFTVYMSLPVVVAGAVAISYIVPVLYMTLHGDADAGWMRSNRLQLVTAHSKYESHLVHISPPAASTSNKPAALTVGNDLYLFIYYVNRTKVHRK